MKDGSTGIFICIYENKLYIANSGDSRGVMCQGGNAVILSEDHKPNLPSEVERVVKYGGHVKKHGEIYRINGDISVSRSFGDIELKDEDTLGEKFVTVEPDVRVFDINDETEFVILACDGLWDVISSEEAVEFIRENLKEYEYTKSDSLKNRNNDIFFTSMALSGLAREKGSKDNISCLIVCFRKDFDLGGDENHHHNGEGDEKSSSSQKEE